MDRGPWVRGPWPEPHDRKPCRQLLRRVPRQAGQRHAGPRLQGSGGEHRRRRWPPRPGCGSWRFGACCPPPRGEETDARGFARPRLARGARPHLAAWGRADHGLVRRRELGRVEQARAVDGHVTQRAERGGTEVQVQAPEKAEAGCGQSGAGARAGGILSKQTMRLVGVRGALVQRAACSRKKCLIPSFWKDSDIVDQLYGPVWNENPPSVVISYVLCQRHLVGAQCGGDRRAGHSRVPHGSRWECPSPAPAPVTCDPPHCSQRAATLALPRPSTAGASLGAAPRRGGPAPRRDPPVGVGRGRAGVLGRVVGRRGQGRHELVQVQGWVGGSAVRRPAGRAGWPCRLREELETEHPRELVRAS